MQPDGVNLWYFKLRLFNKTGFIVLNIKGLQHWTAKIKEIENLSLWQRLNSFTWNNVFTSIKITLLFSMLNNFPNKIKYWSSKSAI